ncbi:hypothetical protein BST61_g3014 [Cercospora zeina]
MADQTPAHHDAPSLPGSPLPKRTKFTEPAANLSVACYYPKRPTTHSNTRKFPTPQPPLRNELEATVRGAGGFGSTGGFGGTLPPIESSALPQVGGAPPA